MSFRDAFDRLDQAKTDLGSLVPALNEFERRLVQDMVRGPQPDGPDVTLRLPPPDGLRVTGRPMVLVAQIAEHSRSALDYAVAALSKTNHPDYDERATGFVIADSRPSFDQNAARGLKYLTAEQKSFIERVQPYNGNTTLGIMRDMTNTVKHRHLLWMLNTSPLEIISMDTENSAGEDGFIACVLDGTTILARHRQPPRYAILGRYDALDLLGCIIECAEALVGAMQRSLEPGGVQLDGYTFEYGSG